MTDSVQGPRRGGPDAPAIPPDVPPDVWACLTAAGFEAVGVRRGRAVFISRDGARLASVWRRGEDLVCEVLAESGSEHAFRLDPSDLAAVAAAADTFADALRWFGPDVPHAHLRQLEALADPALMAHGFLRKRAAIVGFLEEVILERRASDGVRLVCEVDWDHREQRLELRLTSRGSAASAHQAELWRWAESRPAGAPAFQVWAAAALSRLAAAAASVSAQGGPPG